MKISWKHSLGSTWHQGCVFCRYAPLLWATWSLCWLCTDTGSLLHWNHVFLGRVGNFRMICLNGATLYPGPGKAQNEFNPCLTSSGKSCLHFFYAVTCRDLLFFLSFSTGNRYWSLLEAVYFHIRWAKLIQQQTSMLPSHLSSPKASTLSILFSLLLACYSGCSLHCILKKPMRSWGLTDEAFRDCDCVPLKTDRLSNH